MKQVVSFSLSPQVIACLDSLVDETGLNRSQALSQMLLQQHPQQPEISEGAIINRLLETDVTVIGLAIVDRDDGKVAIAKRRGNDELVPNLDWSFIGGGINTWPLKIGLEQTIASSIGLDDLARPEIIDTRIIPETRHSVNKIVAIYAGYHLKSRQSIDKLDAKYSQLVWVDPLEVYRYFNTSVSGKVADYLERLAERASL